MWRRRNPNDLLSLLHQLQSDITDSRTSLVDVLRKSRILAHRLGHEPFKQWVMRELDGYPSVDALPLYRRLQTQPYGDFLGMFGSALWNRAIPPSVFDEEFREIVTMVYLDDGVGYYEELAKKPADENLKFAIPSELVAAYALHIVQDMNCVAVWKPVPIMSIQGLLHTVRTGLQTFVLEVEGVIPDDGEASGRGQFPSPEAVSYVYHTTIEHLIGNVAIGNQQAVQSAVIVQPGNFTSLRQYLASCGIAADDLNELERAIAADPAPSEPGRFGSRVAGWTGSMVGKASSGAWNIGVGAAGNLLAQAIASYYGLGK